MSASEGDLFKSSEEKKVDYNFEQREKEEQITKGKKAVIVSPEDCYEEGLKAINRSFSRVFIKYDSKTGLYFNHHIYIKDKPEFVHGVKYPSNFEPLRPLNCINDFRILLETVCFMSIPNRSDEECEVIRSFWYPLCDPSNPEYTGCSLHVFTLKLKLLEKANAQRNRVKPHELHHSFDNDTKSPISWVPAKSCFEKEVRELTFDKIFPLFPDNERELFKLWLGRVGIGPRNQIPDGRKDPIKHTSRLGIVVLGKQAGIGKSQQMGFLREALLKVGIITETMSNTKERFGVARFANANVAYKDDSDKEELNKFIQNSVTKTIISGDEITTEEKYKDTVPTIPICGFFINANRIDMNLIYNLDAGIVDRIKILNTKGRDRLTKEIEILYPDPKDRPPSLEPVKYFPWLAERHNCDTEAIMLWAFRLATDEFWHYANHKDPLALMHRVHKLANSCEIKFVPNLRLAFMKAMIVSMLFVDKDLDYIPELNIKVLDKGLKAYKKFHGGPFTNVSELIKKDWIKNNKDPLHPWQGFRDVLLPSILEAVTNVDILRNHKTILPIKIDEILDTALTFIYTRGGQKVCGGFAYLNEAWNDAREEFDTLYTLVTNIKKTLTQRELSYLHNPKFNPCTKWVEDVRYCPAKAEKLRPTLPQVIQEIKQNVNSDDSAA